MCARLGPQTPNMMGKPYEAMAQEAYLGPLVAPVITDRLPHTPTQQPVGGLTNKGPPDYVSKRLDDMLSMPLPLTSSTMSPQEGS